VCGVDEAAGFGNHQERSCEVDIHARASEPRVVKNSSIEIFDRGHRKIPFEARFDSHHIGDDSARVECISLVLDRAFNGRTNEMAKAAKAAKKPAAKKAAKKPAAKKKKK
jgi:hypothetical protein